MPQPFKKTFTVTLRGQTEGQPFGWGCAEHQRKWLEDSLHDAVAQAFARYYQCQLDGTSINVVLEKDTPAAARVGK